MRASRRGTVLFLGVALSPSVSEAQESVSAGTRWVARSAAAGLRLSSPPASPFSEAFMERTAKIGLAQSASPAGFGSRSREGWRQRTGLGATRVGMPAQQSGAHWYQSELFKIHIAPVTFWTLSALTYGGRENLREVRNRFIPNFENHLDDYIQFFPVLGVYGLNLAGVPGRNKLGRATVHLAAGALLTTATVGGLKYAVGLERPDGSSSNSWPSGHTATAFAAATFYHKEYGHYSPFHTVAAYGLAGVTGIFRQLNNRHWLTDVFAGAGFGIWSANISYYVLDRLYRDRGRNPEPARTAFDQAPGNPSFVNLKVGYATAGKDLAPQNEAVSAEDGVNFAFEAAWFPWRHVGLGADLTFGVFPMNSDSLVIEDPDLAEIQDGVATEALGNQSLYVGPFVDFPLGDRWSLRAKATGGYWSGATGSVGVTIRDEFQQEFGDYLPLVLYDPADTFGFLLGGAVRWQAGRALGFDFYVDYNTAETDVTLSEIVDVDADTGEITTGASETSKVQYDYWSFGVAVTGLIR